jgi:hypothetical protein
MNLPHLEYALDQGMDLIISKGPRGDYIAEVRTPQIKRHAAGKTMEGALEALDRLLQTVGPKP